ncbi:hypothetical protein [Streptomyces sp. NPDC048340]|uniref:hypothetical protein n=1 Tax=Streptomyces sp. NPDC048340 TaxID=3365537 RepID=UPI00372322E0
MTEAEAEAVTEAVDLAPRVRRVLEGALGQSLADWAGGAPLAEFPAAAYDSLMQLEAVTRLEKEFGLEVGALDTADVTTLDAATARLAELLGTGASAQ